MHELIQYIQGSLGLTLGISAAYGLIVGSFLNVVIYRYPPMFMARRRLEALDALGTQTGTPSTAPPNLFWPPSRSGCCNTFIKPQHNIPVLSWVALRGRCAYCKSPISARYPFVELLASLLAVACGARYGFTWAAMGAMIVSWTLLAMAFIDFDHLLATDDFTLNLLWVGLGFALFNVLVSPKDAIAGAMIGYGGFYLLDRGITYLRKAPAMAGGDMKMGAAIGAWVGMKGVFTVWAIAFPVALVYTVSRLALRKASSEDPIPFGPFLALGSWITLLIPRTWLGFLAI